MNQQKINDILSKYSYLITNKTCRLSKNIRHAVEQEMFIRFWAAIRDQYDESTNLEEFIGNLNFDRLFKSSYLRVVKESVTKIQSRSISYDNIGDSIISTTPTLQCQINVDQLLHADTEIIKKLKECLTEKEKFIIDYILSTNNICDNYDQLSRQLGYTSKGGIKSLLFKIFEKMRQFAAENNIDYP